MKNITFNNCTWAVAYKIDKNTQNDRKTKVTVTAVFSKSRQRRRFYK